MLDLLIVVFASWYVAYTVTSTHGPFMVFERIRKVTTLGGLLTCPVCLAFWAALVLLIAPMGIVTQALAAAGAAMILHGWSGWRFAQ